MAVHAMHQLRAEYAPRSPTEDGELGAVKIWHMVRDSGTTAMCGRELDPRSATRSEEEWGRTGEPLCHTCGALYLREVP